MSNYWQICIEESLSELGIAATDEQIKDLAEIVEGAHDNYSMAMGHDCIPNPLQEENRKLAAKLDHERRLIHCKECGGRGRIYSQGPYRGSDSQCWKCNGEGKHLP